MLMPIINGTTKNQSSDTTKRIGLEKGMINDPEDFDVWNMENEPVMVRVSYFIKQKRVHQKTNENQP